MLLYHGSNSEVKKPDPTVGRRKLDFGLGFYTTTMPAQAEAWARRKAYESFLGYGIVSVFEYTVNCDLKTLTLVGYSHEWLDFVVKNRSSNSESNHPYDIIVGSIADDSVIDSINYYIEELSAGRMSDELVELTLKQLSYQKPNDQVCFATKRSIEALEFLRSYEVLR